ncbi:MAG: hypothetical protein QN178_13995 [Armatimonadota bacterium]|nr:hypothetical protein [Armatimonadota bacterium]
MSLSFEIVGDDDHLWLPAGRPDDDPLLGARWARIPGELPHGSGNMVGVELHLHEHDTFGADRKQVRTELVVLHGHKAA